MNNTSSSPQVDGRWEQQIRDAEESARAAFLAADTATLERLWTDDYAVNSPLQRVLPKKEVLALLVAGRIRHRAYDIEIERLSRHGNVVVVMGKDRVVDPPNDTISHRRFTNIWLLDSGIWRSIARHAHVIAGGAAPASGSPAIANSTRPSP